MSMVQTGWATRYPAEEKPRMVRQLPWWPENDHIFVPAGYELHVKVEARPSAKLRAAKKKEGKTSKTTKTKHPKTGT